MLLLWGTVLVSHANGTVGERNHDDKAHLYAALKAQTLRAATARAEAGKRRMRRREESMEQGGDGDE